MPFIIPFLMLAGLPIAAVVGSKAASNAAQTNRTETTTGALLPWLLLAGLLYISMKKGGAWK